VFSQCLSVHVCNFTKELFSYFFYLHDLYLGESLWKSTKFSTFIAICEVSSHTHKLCWQEHLNDAVKYLGFKAHLSTRAGAHLKAYYQDGNNGILIMVTRVLFQQVVNVVKTEVTHDTYTT
jgi:hypothetical protein